MIVFTLEQLHSMGYKEVAPGKFARVEPSKTAKKSKELPKHLKHIKVGTYSVAGKEHRFRSEWEYIYALYSQFLKDSGNIKDWEYECQRFDFPIKRGTTSYLPDFKWHENNGTHTWKEVKGYLSPKCVTKLKRMAKYFPQEKVDLVREDEIKEIKRLINYKPVPL